MWPDAPVTKIRTSQGIVERIAGAPAGLPPLDAVVSAIEVAGAQIEERRDLSYVRARYALVCQHPEIQERELIKLAALAAATTKALHARGVPEPEASLAAQAGIAVFKIGFERWLDEVKPLDLAAHIRSAVDALRRVTAEAEIAQAPTKKRKSAARATGRG
jgi:hypothetical protein